MNIEQIKTINSNELELCKVALKVLNCSSLWVMKRNADFFNIAVTDKAILQHYVDKKCYLIDPSIQTIPDYKDQPLKLTLGSDCDAFKNNAFLYDLSKIFHVTEFISIQVEAQSEHYCFRFFTQNNRFVFMNNLLNNMPIIKIFMFNLIENLNKEPNQNQINFRLSELQST
ncbi:MAG TPA: hypothetical protein VNK03_06530 [Gammaproteobacteria bacterium]|nr:hypothetical protein [Gammaproteobacteria bacterium]